LLWQSWLSIVCEPQPFSDPAQGDWIHGGLHAPRTALCLYDERHDFLTAVWITNSLERSLPVERWNLLGYPALEVLSHHLLHTGLHLRVFRERVGFRIPDGVLWTGAVALRQHFFDRLDAVRASASGPNVSATKGSIVLAMANSSSARRNRRQASASGESAELAAARQQQCLYFLPLPQGQGSFRPEVMERGL
jgi:hypothetical protein